MRAGIYKHYKGGYYLVLGLARDSTNTHEPNQDYVVYVSMDASKPGPRMRVRLREEFFSLVGSGKASVQRFVYLGDELVEGYHVPVFKPLSPEESDKAPTLSDADIQAALDVGKTEAAAWQHNQPAYQPAKPTFKGTPRFAEYDDEDGA